MAADNTQVILYTTDGRTCVCVCTSFAHTYETIIRRRRRLTAHARTRTRRAHTHTAYTRLSRSVVFYPTARRSRGARQPDRPDDDDAAAAARLSFYRYCYYYCGGGGGPARTASAAATARLLGSCALLCGPETEPVCACVRVYRRPLPDAPVCPAS